MLTADEDSGFGAVLVLFQAVKQQQQRSRPTDPGRIVFDGGDVNLPHFAEAPGSRSESDERSGRPGPTSCFRGSC